MDIGYIYGFDSSLLKSGGAIHVYNLSRQLSNLGHTIHVFEPEATEHCITYPPDKSGVRKLINAVDILYFRIDGYYLSLSHLKCRCLEMNSSKPMVWEINSSAQEMLKTRTSLTKYKGVRGFFQKWARHRQLLSKIRHDEKFRSFHAQKVSCAICVSTALKHYAKGTLNINQNHVIPNGSNPEIFNPNRNSQQDIGYTDNKFKVIYAGDSRWPWQGYDLLKELALYANQQDQDITFLVLDNNPNPKTTNEFANMANFNSIPYEKVPEFILSADACLCLYHDFEWSDYGFHLSPLKLFDYMSCGKPVIGSNIGQIAEIISDNNDGLLTDNQIESIFSKIKLLKENKSVAEAIGKSARTKIISQYNWLNTAKQTADILKSVVAG